MTELTFERKVNKGGRALYASTEVVSDGTSRSHVLYFVYEETGGDQISITLDKCFGTLSSGAFVFVDGAVPDFDTLCAELATAFPVSSNDRFARVIWFHSAQQYQHIEYAVTDTVPENNDITFGRWVVVVGQGSTVENGGENQLKIKKSEAAQENTLQIQIKIGVNQPPQGTKPDDILVPLTGVGAGGMRFEWSWQHRQLSEQFGGDLRLFYGSGEDTSTLRYPLLSPAVKSTAPRPTNDLSFAVTAHPLAPLNDSRTRMALSAVAREGFNKVQAFFMRTPTGSQALLKPVSTLR